MHTHNLETWTHEHIFGQDRHRAGELRTAIIVVITAIMMVIEISTGLLYHSMALLADGLHMGSHTTALGIAVFAYIYSRKKARDRRYTFGVGKINSLAGFASAVLLLGFALIMVTESLGRFLKPEAIAFDQALIVATIGLVVNGFSAWLLNSTPHHASEHQHQHAHDHHHEHDHNLSAAYLHVLADAVTSLLAIFALLAGKFWAANWLDPAMGIVGAMLITKWSIGLIRETAQALLDYQDDSQATNLLSAAIEANSSDKVTDLHLWGIGQGIYAAEVVLVSDTPLTPDEYKARIPAELNVVHCTIEIHQCPAHGA